MLVATLAVWKKTVGTVLNPFVGIPEIATTFVLQGIERAVTEQTVKVFCIGSFMAGIILTFPIAEISGIIL